MSRMSARKLELYNSSFDAEQLAYKYYFKAKDIVIIVGIEEC